MRSMLIIVLLIAGLGLVPACTPYQPPETVGRLQPDNPEYVMVLVFDMSGSYAQYMNNGRAWDAANAMIRKFFRDRAGESDRIVIAQISNAPQGPIWSGSPKAFRAQFHSPSAFRDLLKKYNGASRVYDSITEAVEYAIPMMGQGRAGCFIFSDMEDNLSTPGGEERLVKALAAFGQKGGSVGIYWCGFGERTKWQNHLRGAVKNFVVSADIDADPPLPSWD